MGVDILDELMSSQETVVLDEEAAEDKPIVNMESIHRVVSSSQSFCEIKTRPEDGMYSITIQSFSLWILVNRYFGKQ